MPSVKIRRRGLAFVLAAGLPLLLAADNSSFAPGLWEIRNTPGVATLDGRPLKDLPLGDIKTQRLCVTAAEAADPAAFFLRDTDTKCTVDNAVLARGKVKIAGTCENQVEGAPGTMTLSGRYARDRYNVGFATSVVGENGRMGFSGTLSGHRIGACPVPVAR